MKRLIIYNMLLTPLVFGYAILKEDFKPQILPSVSLEKDMDQVEASQNEALCPKCGDPIIMGGQISSNKIQFICINNHVHEYSIDRDTLTLVKE